jgi:signal transduction histidine kinase
VIGVRFVHPEHGAVDVEVGPEPRVVGRENGGADIVLGDGRVSRRHGKIWERDGAVWYEDLGSSNGSWRDGRRLTEPVRVERERMVVLGETSLTLAGPSMTLQMHAVAEAHVAQVLSVARPAGHTAALYDFVEAMVGLGRDELIARALEVIRATVSSAQRLCVMGWPPREDGGLEPLVASQGTESGASPVSVSLAREAVGRGEALLLSDSVGEMPAVEASVMRHGIRSAIYVPLSGSGEEAMGVLCVDTPRPALGFGADDFQFVRAVGGLLSTALAGLEARAHAEAVQARRDAMVAFLKIASHDLRNPLTVILVGAKAIRAHRDPQIVAKLADHILNAGHRALDLIRTYLEIAALDAGQVLTLRREMVDAAALVEEEIAFARAAVEERHLEGLTIEGRVECGPLSADPQRLRQILANLLSNAIKYSPEGGKVLLRVEEGPVFHVSDQGVGISPDDQRRLFGQFQRVGNNAAEGIGLGLWLTAALVTAHGGRIWVESEEGRGSTFSFTLGQT